ncbi:3052_t:CDS:10 [Entrophospora sp. SA101]|nr:3052_t:CDS:10 [Entrophospora sp. SA101]
MTDNVTLKEDEILAITSIFGEDSFQKEEEEKKATDSVSSFSTYIFKLSLDDNNSITTNNNNVGSKKELKIRFYFSLDYPSDEPPIYEILSVYCGVMKIDDLIRLEIDQNFRKLFVPGEVVIFSWIEWLKDYLLNKLLEEEFSSININDDNSEGNEVNEKVEEELMTVEKNLNLENIKNINSETCPKIFHGEPLEHKKSIFLAHLAKVNNIQEVKLVRSMLLSDRKIAKATHNIMAYRILLDNGAILQDNDDDGETAAGSRLLHLLQMLDSRNVIVVVTRWYGGILLGPDWERLILLKNGDTLPPSMKSKTLKTIFSKQPKSPTQYSKMEEDARNKAAAANRYYKSQLSGANLMRNEYYNIHLPRIITELKSVADECDAGLQYHLARYSYLYESAMVSDASAISPVDLEDGPALRTIVEQINNDSDYLNYVQSFKKKSQKLKINEIPYNQYNMSEQAINIINPTNPKPVFGTDLSELMKRDGGVIPIILRKCVTAVEKYGLESLGIYRLSGVTSQVQSLKSLFDKDAESVDLDSEENLKDINNVSSLLKLWFRELPDPLFPRTIKGNSDVYAKSPTSSFHDVPMTPTHIPNSSSNNIFKLELPISKLRNKDPWSMTTTNDDIAGNSSFSNYYGNGGVGNGQSMMTSPTRLNSQFSLNITM